jgi:hypothetical protein
MIVHRERSWQGRRSVSKSLRHLDIGPLQCSRDCDQSIGEDAPSGLLVFTNAELGLDID